MTAKFQTNRDRQKVAWLLATFFILAIIVIPLILQAAWSNAIFPNVSTDSGSLAGLSFEQAEQLLQDSREKIESEGIVFQLNQEKNTIFPVVTAPGDPDLTYELINIDTERVLLEAKQVGHEGNLVHKWLITYKSLIWPTHIPVYYELNRGRLKEVIANNFSDLETPVRNAKFSYTQNELRIISDKAGKLIDYEDALAQVEKNLNNLDNQIVMLSLVETQPTVSYKQVASLKGAASEVIDRAPFTIKSEYKNQGRIIKWQQIVNASTVASWIVPQAAADGISLGFGEGLTNYLQDQALHINQEPQDAKFEIRDTPTEPDETGFVVNKIDQFQASKDGIKLDIIASVKQVELDLIKNQKKETTVVLEKIKPKVSTAEINNLGINEILGIGKSDFSGSPKNRRINIKVSSDKLNGLLIPPGEEFSLVEALKPFTIEAGYLPELVIKGSRLIKEVGGGACQIGTTTFRAALDAGLDISQRRNHSFAVSYYNDENGLPGTDATIYDPAPDFRFINNTPSHVLIQTHIGDDDILTYEFWGTSDGRLASTSIPVILSKSPAPATKYIETEDLAPGETNCSGHNVPGYNTSFDYSIMTSEGEYKTRSFDSRYRPFQRVCLIGVEKVNETEGLVN